MMISTFLPKYELGWADFWSGGPWYYDASPQKISEQLIQDIFIMTYEELH
jgi:hypothetical protein